MHNSPPAIVCSVVPAVQPGDSVSAFAALLGNASQNLRAAAEMLARLYAADPSVIDRILEAVKGVTRGFLDRLRRAGAGALHPDLVLFSGVQYTLIRALPRDEQDRVMAAGAVDVVVDPATADFRRVPLASLTREEARMVFAPGRIRSRGEQCEILARRAAVAVAAQGAALATADGPGWRMVDGALVILRAPLTLTRADAIRLFGLTPAA